MKSDSEMQSTMSTAVFSLAPLILLSQDVRLYIDAGTGSLVIQLLIASAVGGLVLVRVFWSKIKTFFQNRFSKSKKDNG